MFRNRKLEVVPEGQYTDFTDRLDESKYATKKTVIAAMIPLAVAIPIVVNKLTTSADTYTVTSIPVAVPVPIEPSIPISATESAINSLAQATTTIPVNAPEVIHTGIIADTSLEAIATILDPIVQILVAFSFPVASVIMIGACFLFMFGNSERAWQMIMNAGLGYVLIQMSPLFLQMLRTVGEAV